MDSELKEIKEHTIAIQAKMNERFEQIMVNSLKSQSQIEAIYEEIKSKKSQKRAKKEYERHTSRIGVDSPDRRFSRDPKIAQNSKSPITREVSGQKIDSSKKSWF